jgi:hypothetical protein
MKLFLTFLVSFPMLAGCAHVAPYDRAQLADPSMSIASFDGPAADHVRAVHEGATGGGSVAQSGCGCN